ncbi:MAG TPA: aldo/keto reductase, partial [Candidatus Eisenbacteria bacterium]
MKRGDDVDDTDRRRFLARLAAGATACLAAESVFATVSSMAASPMDSPTPSVLPAGRAILGATGIETAFVAQGTGSGGWNRTSEQVKLGDRGFERLIRHGLERGQNFIDTADLYGSHGATRKALAGVPRGDYTLLTKLWPEPASWCTPSGGAKPEIDRFRKELGTDHLDVVLIHCVGTSNWASRYARVRDELWALKSAGMIRAVGVSCHDLGALQAAASDPWTEVILAR